jgi:hypothetical protein
MDNDLLRTRSKVGSRTSRDERVEQQRKGPHVELVKAPEVSGPSISRTGTRAGL